MKVAVNEYVLSRGISGSSRSLDHVAAALREDPDADVRGLPGPAQAGSRAARLATLVWWDLVGAHRAMRGPGVLVSGCNVGVAAPRHPNVLLMHDTMVLDHPKCFDPAYVAYARALFPLSARHSSAVVAPSEYSAGRIADRFKLRSTPSVIPWPAVGGSGLPTESEVQSKLARPIVTVVGATEPHKYHHVAVLGVRLVRQVTGTPVQLVLVGQPGRGEPRLDEAIQAFDTDRAWIRREPYLSDADLAKQYRDSWLVMQPSLDEGFGLPVLEACGHGVPVVHSGRGALAELHPSGSVSSIAPEDFAERAIALLDPATYRSACADAVATAGRHDWASFSANWRHVVGDAWSGR